MLRSMYSGISGLKNFQTKLDVIGNNIANVNTYGYKKSRASFKDLVSQQISGASSPQENRGGTNPKQVGLGSTLGSIDTVHTQGSMQTTGRLLDLGISGDGMFIAQKGNLEYYTRSGNFYLDQQGNLVTADGLNVQGYGVNAQGDIDDSQVVDLQIDSGTFMPPTETTQIEIDGNIDASSSAGDTATLKVYAIDSLGFETPVEMTLTKTATNNQWDYTMTTTAGTIGGDDTGTITFDPATGTVQSVSTDPVDVTISALNSGAEDLAVNFDLNQITQTNSGNTLAVDSKDGNFEGFLESFSIGSSGEMTGVFTNGNVELLGQLVLANFSNVGGLEKAGNNLYQESNNSGTRNLAIAGDGVGTLTGGALEMSNVDLARSFTEMIVAQRGFQANTRSITTSDQILQELVNLKR